MNKKTERLYDAVYKYSDKEEAMRIKASEQYEIIENAKKAIAYFEEEEATARRKKRNVSVVIKKMGKL